VFSESWNEIRNFRFDKKNVFITQRRLLSLGEREREEGSEKDEGNPMNGCVSLVVGRTF